MATLMQKDALIDGVAQALGHVIANEPNSEDRKILVNMRETIYSSKPEDLDFNQMGDSIKRIIKKYKG